MQRDQAILTGWDEWRLDVREPENVLLFTLPFSRFGSTNQIGTT